MTCKKMTPPPPPARKTKTVRPYRTSQGICHMQNEATFKHFIIQLMHPTWKRSVIKTY